MHNMWKKSRQKITTLSEFSNKGDGVVAKKKYGCESDFNEICLVIAEKKWMELRTI